MICKVAERAAHSVFVSSQNLSLARRQLALPLPDATVIANPVRFSLDEPLPFPAMGSMVKMACVARFESTWKGQANLLKLLAQPPWRDRAWELSLYGEGPDREYLENCVDFHGLAGKVAFRGYVRDVRRIWASNHLMLAPSSGEGMSLALLEAMMCGRPVVMTAVGGAEECVEDGATGFVGGIAAGESFAEALERAWIRRADWEAMGMLAHQRAKEIAKSDPVGSLMRVLQTAAENGNRA
jgi:glycosyltransferase involved in cell wall biosynthesis